MSAQWSPTGPSIHGTLSDPRLQLGLQADGDVVSPSSIRPSGSVTRKPHPVLGSTQEHFRINTSFADEKAAISASSKSIPSKIPELTTPIWGDERHRRNTTSNYGEVFLESIRPKYGSLLPEHLITGDQLDPAGTQWPGAKEAAESSFAKCQRLLGVSLEHIDKAGPERSKCTGEGYETMTMIAELERRLGVPEFACFETLYPEAAIRMGAERTDMAAQFDKEEVDMAEALKIFKSNSNNDEIPNKLQEMHFKIGNRDVPLPRGLLSRLDAVAPIHWAKERGAPLMDLQRSQEYTNLVSGDRPIVVGPLLAQERWRQEIEEQESDEDSHGSSVVELLDYGVVDGPVENQSGGPDENFARPVIQLEEVMDSDRDVWDTFKEGPVNPVVKSRVKEESSIFEKHLKLLRLQIRRSQRRKQEQERAMREERERQRKYDKMIASDLMLGGSGEDVCVVERSPRTMNALRRQHMTFGSWMKQKVMDLLHKDFDIASRVVWEREWVRYLANRGEISAPVTAPLAWSDTENEDFESDLRKKMPKFSDEDVRDMVFQDKADAKRDSLREQLANLKVTGNGFPLASAFNRSAPSFLLSSPILREGWLQQNTNSTPYGFVWAILFDCSLWCFEPSRTDLMHTALPNRKMTFPTHPRPTQSIRTMRIVYALRLTSDRSRPALIDQWDSTRQYITPRSQRVQSTFASIGQRLPERVSETIGCTLRVLTRHSTRGICVKGMECLGRFKLPVALPNTIHFVAADDKTLLAWYRDLYKVWIVARHLKRSKDANLTPNPDFCTGIIDRFSQEANFSGHNTNPIELCHILEDFQPHESKLYSISLRRSGIYPEWFQEVTRRNPQIPLSLKAWNLSNNVLDYTRKPRELEHLLSFIVWSNANSIQLNKCDLGDSLQVGKAFALLLLRNPIECLELTDNRLGSTFVEGFCDCLRDRGPEFATLQRENIDLKATVDLRGNPISNADATKLCYLFQHFLPSVEFLNITDCPSLTLTFFPLLVAKFPKLLRSRVSLTDAFKVAGDNFNDILHADLAKNLPGVDQDEYQAANRPNPIRDAIASFNATQRTMALTLQEMNFAARFASLFLALAVQSLNCRRAVYESCSGDLFLCVDLFPIIPRSDDNVCRLRSLSLSHSDIMSPSTFESAESHYISRGDSTLDPRLRALGHLVKTLSVRQLDLSHTLFVSKTQPARAARFIADLLSDSSVENLDLTGCGIDTDTMGFVVQILKERVATTVEANVAKDLNVWQSGRKLFLSGPIDEHSGGLSKAWTLCRLRLDHNDFDLRVFSSLVQFLGVKCPRLQSLSVVGAAWEVQRAMDVCQELVPTETLRFYVPEQANFLRLEGQYVKTRLEPIIVTPEEIHRNRSVIEEKWLQKAEADRQARKRARYRLRANKLEAYLGEQPIGQRLSELERRVPTSFRSLHDYVRNRIGRRLGRVRSSVFPDGIMPAFRTTAVIRESLGNIGTTMGDEIRHWAEEDGTKVIDVSQCVFSTVEFEALVRRLHKMAGGIPHLDALYMVNCGIDEFHLLDICQILIHYPIRVQAIDLSLNRLSAHTADQSKALRHVLRSLNPKVVILDANWFLDSAALGLAIAELVACCRTHTISVRNNVLGATFAGALTDALLHDRGEQSSKAMEQPTNKPARPVPPTNLVSRELSVGTSTADRPMQIAFPGERPLQRKKTIKLLNSSQMFGADPPSPLSADINAKIGSENIEPKKGSPFKKSAGKAPGKVKIGPKNAFKKGAKISAPKKESATEGVKGAAKKLPLPKLAKGKLPVKTMELPSALHESAKGPTNKPLLKDKKGPKGRGLPPFAPKGKLTEPLIKKNASSGTALKPMKSSKAATQKAMDTSAMPVETPQPEGVTKKVPVAVPPVVNQPFKLPLVKGEKKSIRIPKVEQETAPSPPRVQTTPAEDSKQPSRSSSIKSVTQPLMPSIESASPPLRIESPSMSETHESLEETLSESERSSTPMSLSSVSSSVSDERTSKGEAVPQIQRALSSVLQSPVEIPPAPFISLKENPGKSLQTLDLRNNLLTGPAIKELSKALASRCPNIRSLKVARNHNYKTNPVDAATMILKEFGGDLPHFVELSDVPLPGTIPIPLSLLQPPNRNLQVSTHSHAMDEKAILEESSRILFSIKPPPKGDAESDAQSGGSTARALTELLSGPVASRAINATTPKNPSDSPPSQKRTSHKQESHRTSLESFSIEGLLDEKSANRKGSKDLARSESSLKKSRLTSGLTPDARADEVPQAGRDHKQSPSASRNVVIPNAVATGPQAHSPLKQKSPATLVEDAAPRKGREPGVSKKYKGPSKRGSQVPFKSNVAPESPGSKIPLKFKPSKGVTKKSGAETKGSAIQQKARTKVPVERPPSKKKALAKSKGGIDSPPETEAI